MAAKTRRLRMATTKGEPRFFVIKSRNFFPTVYDVARLTFFAEIAFVWLAVGMASKASVWCLAEFFAGHMALFAGNCFVAALQGKFCFRMVEDNGLDLDEFMVKASMFTVACITLGFVDHQIAAMKLVLGIQIFLNVFMTVQAEIGLRFFFQNNMAVAAIIFQLGVG